MSMQTASGASNDRSRDYRRVPAGVGWCSRGRPHVARVQAKKALIQAKRNRFPKNFEREAEVHQRSAEMITTLSPDDV